MTGPVVRESVVNGLDALVLENAAIRVTVLPALSGHVAELVDRAADRDVLWHNPRTSPRPAPLRLRGPVRPQRNLPIVCDLQRGSGIGGDQRLERPTRSLISMPSIA